MQAFSEAIALDPSNAVRIQIDQGLPAMIRLKAFKDAEEAVRLDPAWPKACAQDARRPSTR